MEMIVGFVMFLFLLAIGLFVGGATERQHFRRLQRREDRQADLVVSQLKSFPYATAGDAPPRMVVAEVVIATDYLKSFLAKLRNIFGGGVRSYETLLVRARREATLRILEEARRQGYNAVCNIRLETADVGGNSSEHRVAMAAIIATGTAYHAS